jgi:predicted amidohydrolase YtcJ
VPRYLADLAILRHNPLEVDVSTIADIDVLGTAVAGRLWWA